AIRSVINTKTAIFCLVNFDKQELIIQAYSSDIKEAIVRKRKIPLGNDIVSQIVINRKPEILTEINPDAEVDLIPYYSVQTNTQSFIGMPVIYKKSVIGILCVDSTISDAYDSVTVNFLGQFTKLISALVHSYTEKYDLIQSAKILNVINAFKKVSYDKNLNIEDLYHSYIEILKTNFDFQTIGICSYNNHSGSWYISAYYTSLSDKNYEGLEIDPNEVLIGESILSYKTIFVSPLANDRIRVMKGENSLENGYFLSVPLKTYSYNYGALYVEGNNPTSFTNNEIYALEVLGEQIGGIIEQLFYSDALNVNNVFEAQTGILSTNSFLNRIIQELNRTNDFQGNFCLCHIRVDKYGAYYEEMFKDKSELIYQHILNIIKKYLKQYDILGKIDDNTFGIILVGMNLNQAQLWAERLRTEIAKTFLIIKTKRYNATVSIGIAEANNMTTLEEILSNCSKALDIASQKSNKVIIYQ
ncbi:MAG: GAF domain-containing protein, partial [Candidatus Woesearchaeota archaeon]